MSDSYLSEVDENNWCRDCPAVTVIKGRSECAGEPPLEPDEFDCPCSFDVSDPKCVRRRDMERLCEVLEEADAIVEGRG
jgi:hypothetical protein